MNASSRCPIHGHLPSLTRSIGHLSGEVKGRRGVLHWREPPLMRELIYRVASRVFLTSSQNVNSLQRSSPHQLIYVGVASMRHYRRLSTHKSSKNLQYTTTSRLHIVNISQNSADHLLSFLCRKHATEDSKASPRDAIDTAGAASSESSSGLHRSAKHKTLATKGRATHSLLGYFITYHSPRSSEGRSSSSYSSYSRLRPLWTLPATRRSCEGVRG